MDMGLENHTNEDKSDSSEPSECKIPKKGTDTNEEEVNELIEVKVIYNKNKYDVSAPSNSTIADFKKQLQGLLGITTFKHYVS